MEVGAVKQAFNNEIILLKRNLNQAKIQTIHKLTRKAKTFMEKKLPDPQKEKLKRKAESAVSEVLIIKKIKAKDIARFIVTHSGKLNDFLNKPIVDNDKACARLLLHKALQDKYKHIREKFSDISIKDLFMSRVERRKLKKEAREKQKNKKKGKDKKDKSDAVNVEGEWDVEMNDDKNIKPDDDKMSNDKIDDGNDTSDIEDDKSNDGVDKSDDENDTSDAGIEDDGESKQSSSESNYFERKVDTSAKSKTNDSDIDGSSEELNGIVLPEKVINVNSHKNKTENIKNVNLNRAVNKEDNSLTNRSKNLDKKSNTNKNKNLKSKLEKRNFHKETDEISHSVTKMVDPFFITSTGDNYMSLVEPREPDEVKDVHRQGNRQYRRAVMFGHVPKIKPKRNFEPRNNNFNKHNNSEVDSKNFNNKRYNQSNKNFDRKESFNKKSDRGNAKDDNNIVPEKLHPSWEAKKKQSGILPYQGKKIVFE